MITATALLDSLQAAGFTLTAEGGKVLVRPAGKLSPEQRQSIRDNKPALLELLAAQEAAQRLIDDAEEHFCMALDWLIQEARLLEAAASADSPVRTLGIGLTRRWARRLTRWSEQLCELSAPLRARERR
jgi:hypothetical protein